MTHQYNSKPTALVDGLAALASWLEALGIDYSRPTSAYSLKIQTPRGEDYFLSVDQSPGWPGTVFPAKVLSTKYRRSDGYPVFETVLKALGFKVWNIFPREMSGKRLRIQDDLEQIAFRHHVLRSSVNPPNAALEQYAKDVDASVRRCYTVYRDTFLKFGYRREDLLQFALVWAINFHNKCRLIPVDGEDVTLDNLYLLRSFVRQRFLDLKQRIDRKSRNILPEGAEDVVHSQYLDAAHNSISETLETLPEAKVTIRRSKVPTKVRLSAQGEPADIGLIRRRAANGKKFRALLAALPPAERLKALKQAASDTQGPARKLAERLLASQSDSELNQDASSVDTGSN